MSVSVDDRYSKEETEQRLVKVLDAAFSTFTKPLTDIPTRADESRRLQLKRAQSRPRRQRKRRASCPEHQSE